MLVGSSEAEGEVALSLQKLQNYSLFNGQVVAVKAHHAGAKLVATEMFDNVKLQFPEKSIAFDFESGKIPGLARLCVVEKNPFDYQRLTYGLFQGLWKW